MTAAWAVAALCAALMGFAIQRGGTCTVAAVEEWMTQRRANRGLALLEASLWVAGGLALAQWAGLPGSRPAAYEAGAWTVPGGLLLGLGAWVNRACVFGAVARFGSGEWSYAATPVGFYVGCLSVMPLFARPPLVPAPLPASASALFLPAFALFVAWRLGAVLRASRGPGWAAALQRRVWSPHGATVVIGVSFVLLLLLAGRWAYTDVLADLAAAMRGSAGDLALPLGLLMALYAGALVGGRTAGRWQSRPPGAGALLRCFAGGLLMGWGSLLIPGSNDGLILIGLPMLQPHAVLGLAAMVGAICLAMRLQQAAARRSANRP